MGKFIVFEGLDGCGKTSQAEMLRLVLEKRGEKVWITHEPSSFKTGAYLKHMLSLGEDEDIYLQAALFLADRIEHVTNSKFGIKKHLDDDFTVICDRYYYSSFAYQGMNADCDYEWVKSINLGCDKLLKPDLCIFIDVDPKICKGRIDIRGGNIELYEQSVTKMNTIRKGFLNTLKDLKDNYGHNIVIINGERDINIISKEILSYV